MIVPKSITAVYERDAHTDYILGFAMSHAADPKTAQDWLREFCTLYRNQDDCYFTISESMIYTDEILQSDERDQIVVKYHQTRYHQRFNWYYRSKSLIVHVKRPPIELILVR